MLYSEITTGKTNVQSTPWCEEGYDQLCTEMQTGQSREKCELVLRWAEQSGYSGDADNVDKVITYAWNAKIRSSLCLERGWKQEQLLGQWLEISSRKAHGLWWELWALLYWKLLNFLQCGTTGERKFHLLVAIGEWTEGERLTNQDPGIQLGNLGVTCVTRRPITVGHKEEGTQWTP